MGNLIITVPDAHTNKILGVDNDKEYETVNVLHLAEVLSDRYKIDLSPNDFTSVKRISKSGTIQVAFNDLKPDSRYRQFVSKIKSKGANKKGGKVYANFALTNRRNNLLYTIRGAWRDKKVEKFFVDYDG